MQELSPPITIDGSTEANESVASATVTAPNSLGSRFARGAVWSLIGTVASQGLALAASVVTARLLGKSGFGELGMINSTVGVFGMLAGLGLGLTTTKYVAEFRSRDPERAGRIVGLTSLIALSSGGLIAIAILAFAPLLSTRVLNAPHLAPELRIGALLLLIYVLNGIQTGALSGLEAFKEIAKAKFLRGTASFPLIVAGVILWRLPGAVWGLVITAALGWLFNSLFLRKECRGAGIRLHFNGIWREGSILWRFSLPAVLADVAAGPAIWAANAILANQTNGYSELGLFSAADQWRNALMFLPNILLQVALPILSSLDIESSDSDRSQFARTFEITQTLTLGVVLPLGVLLICFSDLVMSFYGAQFSRGVPSLIGVALTVMIMGVSAATGPAIQASGRMWIGFTVNLVWGIVMLGLVWSFAPRRGANALAYAPAAAYVVLAILTFLILRRELGNGALLRAMAAIAWSVGTAALGLMLPATVRHIVALPLLAICIYATLFVFSTRHTRQLLFSALGNLRALRQMRERITLP